MGQGRSAPRSVFSIDDDNGTVPMSSTAKDTVSYDVPPPVGTDNVHRHRARSSLWILLFLLAISTVLWISTGVRYATSGNPRCVCPPPLAPIIVSNDTCTLPVSTTATTTSQVATTTTTSSSTTTTTTTEPGNGTVQIVRTMGETNMNIPSIPTLGAILADPAASPLAISAINALIALHLLLTINTVILVKGSSLGAAFGMILAAVLLYVMLYVSFIHPQWYIAVTPLIILGLWGLLATYGLFRYHYGHPTKRMFYIAVVFISSYVIPAILYVAFSAVPYANVPMKDVAVLVCELVMLVSFAGFSCVLAYYTRLVSYAVEVRKGYTMV